MKKIIAFGLIGAIALPQLKTDAQIPYPAAVAACASQPEICLVTAVAAGWLLHWRGHQQPQYVPAPGGNVQPDRRPLPQIQKHPYPANSQMIDDPEAQNEDWSDYIWADANQARRKCQEYADRHGVRLVDVKVGKGNRHECFFRG